MMREREIRVKDLIIEILLGWRVIIVWMLIGGLLMGVFSYVRSYRTAENQKNQIAELEQQLQKKQEKYQKSEEEYEGTAATKEYLEDQLTEQQMYTVVNALNLEGYSADKRAYLQESIWMQADALNVPRMRLTFMVISTNEDMTYSIERVYEDLVSSGLSQWIEEESDDELSAASVGELISVSRSSNALLAGGDSFCINIYHKTQSGCEELTRMVEEFFLQQNEILQEELGQHEIKLVNKAFSNVMVPSLIDNRRNLESNIIAWDSAAANIKEAFSEDEWKYYNFLKTGKVKGTPERYQNEDEESEKEESDLIQTIVVTTPSVSLKYVILGMMMLAFVYAGYVFLKCIFSARLSATDNVKSLYSVPQLGQISATDTKKKLFGFVDSWILKLRDKNRRTFTTEEATGLTAVAVKIAAKKEGLDAVYCIGCNLQEKTTQVVEKIQNTLKEENIEMNVLNNVLYNQETMAQLEHAKGAFLLEQVGETLYTEIAQEIELLQRQGITVLGIVVVE